MSQGALLRFLDLLRQELGAADSRAEVGGADPTDPRLLWTNLPGGWRLVVCFSEPPAERARKQGQLEALVEGFSQTLEDGQLPAPASPAVDSAFRRLDAALEALRARTGGVGAVIVDIQSPVLWGSSSPQRHVEDVEQLVEVGRAIEAARKVELDLDELLSLEVADIDARLRDVGVSDEAAVLLQAALADGEETARRHYLLTCSAVARARAAAGRDKEARWAHHESQFGYFVRSFANIYLLVVVFEGAFSELHVESTVLHALPAIEQLLLSLPPLDPKPRGARVIKFRR